MPDVWIPEREEIRLPRQCNSQKREVCYWLEPGHSAATIAVVQGQKAPSRGGYPNLSGMHKRLVAGLSRLVTCLQSNFIGTNFRWLLFKLRHPRAFQLSLCFLLGAYWLAGSRLPDGGRESHHFRGNRNPGLGCLPAPAAPHHVST